jgi:NtrC-family two-component system sensor histidine kinase KinB
MKIKRKLSLGLLFLFGVIILLITLAVFYVTKLSKVSEEVLKDNDISIEYVDRMLLALDHSKADELDEALSLQEKNITEPGEAELTLQARTYFEEWKKQPKDSSALSLLRDRLRQIAIVNRAAINRKNEAVQNAADEAKIWLGVIGTICFIVSFTIIINFPGYIANPISKLTESIKQIARKNYEERLHFNSEDEFGELSEAFNSMAEKLDEYESSNLSSILFEKKRIEAIINKMHDPLIGLDEKRNVIFANSEALKILGIEEKELLGKYAPDVALRNDLLRNLIKDIVSSKQLPENTEPVKIVVDGKENYFSKDILKISNVPTGEKKSILIGFVILLRNITPFKELDLAKTNFIATVSHELKTPIASIQMCTQLLSDARVGAMNEEQRKIVQTVNQETQRLMKITSELLNLAQVETGSIRLVNQKVSPQEIIQYALDATRFTASQKRIALSVDAGPQVPAINADPDKTVWVMVNLISNAIHYSPEESVINIKVVAEYPNVTFSVQDFGPGIERQYQEKIFDKYFKVPGSDLKKEGTGLGLAISKEFITSQGGNIWVESELGKGSTFYFSLPAQKGGVDKEVG